MYEGKALWDGDVTKDMATKRLPSRKEILTYRELSASIYIAFQDTAARFPGKTAVVDDAGRSYTYQNLAGKIRDFSAWLALELGVHKGDHVILMLYNSIEFCTVFLALNRIGAVAVPMPTKYKKEEVCSLFQKSDAGFIICDAHFEAYFEAYRDQTKMCILPEKAEKYALEPFLADAEALEVRLAEQKVKEDDAALLMFTSGTTSQSKGVTIKNYQIMHAVVSYQRILRVTEKEKAILPVPIYLITGLVAIFGLMMYAGGTVYLNKFFDNKRVLEDIRKYGITFFHASPTVFTLILMERENYPELPTLRMLVCGSSNMPPEKIKMLHRWLPRSEFRTVYGLTETTSPGTIFPSDASVSPYIGSSGIPIPGLEYKIVNDEGKEVPVGRQGEILVRGTNITEGYYRGSAPFMKGGWLDTGDIGYFNSEGYLYISDRKKDMINRGGEKICSFDIENLLLGIEGIEDSAVVGIPHELYGEVPVALVKLSRKGTLTEIKIKGILKEKTAGYKIPERILFADKIPVTENMKTDKKKIRQMFINLLHKENLHEKTSICESAGSSGND